MSRFTYQRELKLAAMERYGLTWEQVDLPYEEWAAIRDRFNAENEAAHLRARLPGCRCYVCREAGVAPTGIA